MRPYDGARFAGRKLREGGGREYAFEAARLRVDGVEAAVQWAFGSGVQAITPVFERHGRWVEHRVTWYRTGNRLGLTPGHDPAPPLDPEDALGVVQTERNAARCFDCHMTAGEPGVRCQSCHGAGAAHRAQPSKANIRRDASVAACAACHRAPDRTFAAAMPELEDPRSIRFAPVGLEASRCFQRSPEGKLTCVTCHDPHSQKPVRAVAAVCGACHSPRAKARACPRTPACAQCHMPASSPIPNLRFTDHRIR